MGTDSEALHALVERGNYADVLTNDAMNPTLRAFARDVLKQSQQQRDCSCDSSGIGGSTGGEVGLATVVGLAALNAFLQITVTGPPVEAGDVGRVEEAFLIAASEEGLADTGATATASLLTLRRACAKSLEVDGVSVYPYAPNLELFCLARWIFTSSALSTTTSSSFSTAGNGTALNGSNHHLPWLRLRAHVWHYKLLTQPSLGAGAVFNKSTQWTDVPSLQESIEQSLDEVEKELLLSGHAWKTQDKVLFLLEKASICIMLGWDTKAKEALRSATERNRFVYALSGALGKRTRFQEKSTSQLVVLAKSAPEADGDGEGDSVAQQHHMPTALPLNDDTLLESLEFSSEEIKTSSDVAGEPAAPPGPLPPVLSELQADAQPQLTPLDQIILLTEATLKDAFSPADSLTSEEILPFAVRVISDKSRNWQIYTQALLVRSRIEVHRGRTVERSVLQMQALVDQIVVESASSQATGKKEGETKADKSPGGASHGGGTHDRNRQPR